MMKKAIADSLCLQPDILRNGYMRFSHSDALLEYENGHARYISGPVSRQWDARERELPTLVKMFANPVLRPRLADPDKQLPLRAGMLGGAFNPPTLSHERLARNAAQVFDIVLVIPAPDAFLTGYKGLTEGNHSEEARICMLQAAFRHCPRILVMEPEASRTYNTLCSLSRQFEQVSLILGADNVRDLPNWYRHEDLLRDFSIYVAPRAGEKPEGFPSLPDTGEYTHFSSTQVRRRIREGLPFEDMVSPAVYNCLIEKA